jgi:hypothetical protein
LGPFFFSFLFHSLNVCCKKVFIIIYLFIWFQNVNKGVLLFSVCLVIVFTLESFGLDLFELIYKHKHLVRLRPYA